ncbi:MAG TPA: type 1 glutamine amidotransferase, partial [Rhodothermales bacterium]
SVSLTAEGMADPLFGSFPRSFRVNMGHHDRVARLPGGAVELAFNDSQRNQALRMGDRPMYGTQFHTELDAERYRERLIAYRALYDEVASQEAYDAVIESLRTTTEADHLLHDFLRRFAVEEES